MHLSSTHTNETLLHQTKHKKAPPLFQMCFLWVAFLRLVGAFVALFLVWSVFHWHGMWLLQGCSSHSSSVARLLLIGDPQMESRGHSRHSQLNARFNDLYYSYVFHRASRACGASHAILLGDIFSHHLLPEDEFQERLSRLRNITAALPASTRVVSLSGNHDVGYGAHHSLRVTQRWEQFMGPQNGLFPLDDSHLFVWVNTMALDGSSEPSLTKEAWDHVRSAARTSNAQNRRVVLAIHIPLHKPAGSCPCDTPNIERTANGQVWEQTLLSPETSKKLLNALKPVAVFSGHDHCGCKFEHEFQGADNATARVVELTLQSVQAEYWGNTACYVPSTGRLCSSIFLHNSLLIGLVITCVVWAVLVILHVIISNLCCRERRKQKNE